MSTAQRKLQAEIDKTTKKVVEGIEDFHELLQKYEETTVPSHKEKLESELKKEIKKLQRLRDQIKTWQTSNDIKDKDQLQDTRRLIENEMEKFKLLEKEMKIKAYSKEGLTQGQKVDPKEKEKQNISNWVNQCVLKLNTEIDFFEAEIEKINASKKGKKLDSTKQELFDRFEKKIKRHKFHTEKLEAILRSLENGYLEVEDVNEIKDDVDYYIECNQEDEFEENMELYEGLDLIESKQKAAFLEAEKTKGLSSSALPIKSSPKPVENLKLTEESKGNRSEVRLDKADVAVHESNESLRMISNQSVPSKIQGPSFASAAQMGKNKTTGLAEVTELSLHDLIFKSFESLQKELKQMPVECLQEKLGFDNMGDYFEVEKPKVFVPKNPVNSPLHYPKIPLSILENPSIYDRFDLDTLFFIFYYQSKTINQYLAAKELKRQSWRFHKKYLTWFQRHEEPKTITSDFEHGTYIYFDFEGSWCQRKKAEFTFEYRYLEDEICM